LARHCLLVPLSAAAQDLNAGLMRRMPMSELPKIERRSLERTSDDADWESKVLARVSSRLQEHSGRIDEPSLGWESTVLDTLRKRIEQGPR
jgi:hypothetical protein